MGRGDPAWLPNTHSLPTSSPAGARWRHPDGGRSVRIYDALAMGTPPLLLVDEHNSMRPAAGLTGKLGLTGWRPCSGALRLPGPAASWRSMALRVTIADVFPRGVSQVGMRWDLGAGIWARIKALDANVGMQTLGCIRWVESDLTGIRWDPSELGWDPSGLWIGCMGWDPSGLCITALCLSCRSHHCRWRRSHKSARRSAHARGERRESQRIRLDPKRIPNRVGSPIPPDPMLVLMDPTPRPHGSHTRPYGSHTSSSWIPHLAVSYIWKVSKAPGGPARTPPINAVGNTGV